jgi:hypothetical protein
MQGFWQHIDWQSFSASFWASFLRKLLGQAFGPSFFTKLCSNPTAKAP